MSKKDSLLLEITIHVLVLWTVAIFLLVALNVADRSDACRILMLVSTDYEFRLRPRGNCQVLAPSGEWTAAEDVRLFVTSVEGE